MNGPKNIARTQHELWAELPPIVRAKYTAALVDDPHKTAVIDCMLWERMTGNILPRPSVEDIERVIASQWDEFKAWQASQKLN